MGTSDSASLPAAIGRDWGKSSEQGSLLYGWPTLVTNIPREGPKVVPLFIVAVESGEEGAADRFHAQEEPILNPVLKTGVLFDPSALEEIVGSGEGDLPWEDPEELVEVSGRIGKALDVEVETLDPSSLDSELPRETGIFNVAISVKVERSPSQFIQFLIEEIAELRHRTDWQKTPAAFLLQGQVGTVSPARSLGRLAAPLPCGQSQEETLERLRGEPLTVVTGPPGTGKTQLVANAVANAWLDRETVLVTSTNNAAVDVAVERANQLHSGTLIRTGNKSARTNLADIVTHVVREAVEHGRSGTEEAVARSQLSTTQSERTELLANLERLSQLDAELLDNLERREDAALVLWDQPLAPTLPMKARVLERRARRVLRTRFFRGFRTRSLLRSIGAVEFRPPAPDLLEVAESWAGAELRHSKLLSAREHALQAVGGRGENALDEEWHAGSKTALQTAVAASVRRGIRRLSQCSGLGGGRTFREAIKNSLQVLRGWACTSLSMQTNFPLEAGLFDLVIIDEASQCSLATALPLAYRARRLAVIGDPNQLTPIVPVAGRWLARIAQQVGLDDTELRRRGVHHKDGSAYLAFLYAAVEALGRDPERPGQPVFLDEHYRCHPQIARWFNRVFYDEQLEILTAIGSQNGAGRAVLWID
ncbi:MAG: AAA family ATPase, partial [Proteobacteria bacterium]|nr:AAA family ATPase [Pseudomonadota bacterium]